MAMRLPQYGNMMDVMKIMEMIISSPFHYWIMIATPIPYPIQDRLFTLSCFLRT
jgi:hypothetical protein